MNKLMMIFKKSLFCLVLPVAFLFVSCNDDKKEEQPEIKIPSVTFENYEGGVYAVKTGKEIVITPVVENASNPMYAWKIDGKIVSTNLSYRFSSRKLGEHFLSFHLNADNGELVEELMIIVLEKTPPVVSLPVDNNGVISAYIDRQTEIVPQLKYTEDAVFEWTVNGVVAGEQSTLVFLHDKVGDIPVVLTVVNEDGEARAAGIIRVTQPPKLVLEFSKERIIVPKGRTVCISPYVDYSIGDVSFSWSVDGQPLQDEVGANLYFTSSPQDETGKIYTITVSGVDDENSDEATVLVQIGEPVESYRRFPSSSSNAYQTDVFEYLPAPGQYINEGYYATTMEQANSYALERLEQGAHLSLGGFGGYIIVGFDHSIANVEGRKDFAVGGNAFFGSSEPGIVWVMQDENGNGLPDDTWYELKGSETGKATSLSNYAVTYFKPASSRMGVTWRDNFGNSGVVDYIGIHSQDYYYPNWVNTSTYTLRGTCLEARNSVSGSNWTNKEYDWGYADNYGEDRVPNDGTVSLSGNFIYFDIDNAIYQDGSKIQLDYIDFIKVQTGVNAKSGGLGEISTEVTQFVDLHVVKR